MLELVLKKQKTKKYIRMNVGFFLFFLVLYTWIDSFNMSYSVMQETYGLGLVIANIALNLLMALLSTAMMGLTAAQFEFSGKQSAGSNLSFASVLLGILTYGCTPCVISFFTAIGISFSVAVLPLAGFPYKLISFGLLIIGITWVVVSIRRTVCTIPPQQ